MGFLDRIRNRKADGVDFSEYEDNFVFNQDMIRDVVDELVPESLPAEKGSIIMSVAEGKKQARQAKEELLQKLHNHYKETIGDQSGDYHAYKLEREDVKQKAREFGGKVIREKKPML